MKFRHIHFIINPAAAGDEPVLGLIHEALKATKIDWDVSLTKLNLDAGAIASKLIGKSDLIAVYGGDGCVTSVAAALHGTKMPILILPGGTANVMAKELGVPLKLAEALSILQPGKHRMKAVDMGTVNGEPFILRVNLGIMADMVLEADRRLKDKIGQLAYGVTTLKTIAEAKTCAYRLKIDGLELITEGVSLTVTNSGNMGVAGLELLPGISVTDGKLDIIIMKDNDWFSVLKIAGSTLLQKTSDALLHRRCREVEIILAEKTEFICDDTPRMAKKLSIAVQPRAINFLIPC